jgi:peptidoglycan/LPS O-acetylase OafA/YrhL
VWSITQAGFLGVDLFFALSGYLIGLLFFMEKNKTGTVNIFRFIVRRMSRTVPPYLIVLIPSYLAVYLYRGESFDFGYLVFAQNYYQEIPFFLISWSLCVEEHFYLILPALLTVLFSVFRRPGAGIVVVLFLMSLIPLALRFHYQGIDPKPFGFYQTATHLKFDPLILGVMFAYLSIYFKSVLVLLLKFKHVIYTCNIVFLLTFALWPGQWMYSIGAYMIGLNFAVTVAVSCEDRNWSISGLSVVPIVATASYAIYLTHVLSMHLLEMLFDRLEFDNIALQTSLIILAAGCVGYVFYIVVEKPVMNWRSRAIPSYRRTIQESDDANR